MADLGGTKGASEPTLALNNNIHVLRRLYKLEIMWFCSGTCFITGQTCCKNQISQYVVGMHSRLGVKYLVFVFKIPF